MSGDTEDLVSKGRGKRGSLLNPRYPKLLFSLSPSLLKFVKINPL